MINPKKVGSWFSGSMPMRQIVPLARFVSDNDFQVKTGGYGSMFQVAGIDDESLTEELLAGISRRLVAAFKKLEPSITIYQYLVKRRGCTVVHKPAYASRAVQSLIHDRVNLLQSKADLGQIDLFFCILSGTGLTGKSLPAQIRKANGFARRTLSLALVSLEAQLGEICQLRNSISKRSSGSTGTF